MTTKYNSEEEAVTRGLYYAGVADEVRWKGIKIGKITVNQFGCTNECNLYEIHHDKTKEILTREGSKIQFAIGPFRSGFELWLIGKGGFMVRT